MPEVVFQHALLHRHLRAHVQMLHLAAATGARVQAEMRALRRDPLRRFAADFGDHALLPIVLGAVHIALDPLKWQRAFDEDDFAIGAVGNALGFDVE